MASNRSVTGITLAGSDHALLFRVRDILDLERALGGESLEQAIAQRGYSRLVQFLFYGLRHNVEGLKPDRVVALVEKTDLDYAALWNKVGDALAASGIIRAPSAEASDIPTPGRTPEGTAD